MQNTLYKLKLFQRLISHKKITLAFFFLLFFLFPCY
uniref:Uncharacterized protein n=1 Tax=Rhizophora mucronata TaxID=61149 RepID=A0A2P2M579_RHIMU